MHFLIETSHNANSTFKRDEIVKSVQSWLTYREEYITKKLKKDKMPHSVSEEDDD